MKKLLILILFVPSLLRAQTNIATLPIFIGNLDSAKVLGSINGLTKNFWGVDLVKSRVKYTDTSAMFAGYPRVNRFTDSIALMRALANSRMTLAEANGLYVPLTRTITINGTAFDLTANRSWTIAGGGSGVSNNADSLGGQNAAYYLARVNHTGLQAISTVTGLQVALDGKQVSGSYATLAKVASDSSTLRGLINTNTTNIDLKANIASPTFTGIPKINTDTISTKAYARSVSGSGGGGGGVNEGLDATLSVNNTTNKRVVLNRDFYTNGSALDFVDNGATPPSSREFIRFIPSNGRGNDAFVPKFIMTQNTAVLQNLPDSQSNYTYGMGLNYGNVDGNNGSIGISMEGYFKQGGIGQPLQEFHLYHGYKNSVGGGVRFLTYAGAEDGSSSGLILQSKLIGFSDAAGIEKVSMNWAGKSITYADSLYQLFSKNNVPVAYQRNAANTDNIALPYVNAINNTVVGNLQFPASSPAILNPTGGISFGSSAQKLIDVLRIYTTSIPFLAIENTAGADIWEFRKTATQFQLYTNEGGFTPLTITKGAPNNAIGISAGGSVGIGINGELYKLTVNGTLNGVGIGILNLNTPDATGLAMYGTNTGQANVIDINMSAAGDVVSTFRNMSNASGSRSRIEISAAGAGSAQAVARFYTATSDWHIGTARNTQSFDIVKGYALDATTPAFSISNTTEVASFKNAPIMTLATHASEAAAVTAGLISGTLYKTSTGEVRVKL